MDKKPGYKTTEFWLATAATMISFVLASGALDGMAADSPTMRVIGLATAGLTALGYTVSRTLVKRGAK